MSEESRESIVSLKIEIKRLHSKCTKLAKEKDAIFDAFLREQKSHNKTNNFFHRYNHKPGVVLQLHSVDNAGRERGQDGLLPLLQTVPKPSNAVVTQFQASKNDNLSKYESDEQQRQFFLMEHNRQLREKIKKLQDERGLFEDTENNLVVCERLEEVIHNLRQYDRLMTHDGVQVRRALTVLSRENTNLCVKLRAAERSRDEFKERISLLRARNIELENLLNLQNMQESLDSPKKGGSPKKGHGRRRLDDLAEEAEGVRPNISLVRENLPVASVVADVMDKVDHMAMPGTEKLKMELATLLARWCNRSEARGDMYRRLLLSATKVTKLSLDETTAAVACEAASLLNADRCAVYLVDRTHQQVTTKAGKGANQSMREPIGKGIAGYVAETEEVVSLADARTDPRFTPEYDKSVGFTTKTLLAFPVKDQQESTVAVLQALNKEDGSEFNSDDQEFISVFGDHCGAVLASACLRQNTIKRVHKLKLMLRMQSDLRLCKSAFDVCDVACSHGLNILDADKMTIFLVEMGSMRLVQRTQEDNNKEHSGQVVKHPLTGLAGYVAQTRQLVQVVNPYNHEMFNGNVDLSTTRSMLCVPILAQGASHPPLAVLQLVSKQNVVLAHMEKESLELMSLYVCSVAVALAATLSELPGEPKIEVQLSDSDYSDLLSQLPRETLS